jgi:hypothetical protein
MSWFQTDLMPGNVPEWTVLPKLPEARGVDAATVE